MPGGGQQGASLAGAGRRCVPSKSHASAAADRQARKRLDTQTLELIAGQVAWSLERNTLEAEKWLGGRPVKIIDGTPVSRCPDPPKNQSVWPQPSSQKPGCGFPLMKLVGLFSLSSGALLDHATANEHVHESQLFRHVAATASG